MSLKSIFKDKGPGKTVFILGAGFSKAAGYPLQAEILKDIINNSDLSTNFLDTPLEVLSTLHFARKFNKGLKGFLQDVFYGVEYPTLEDIFTTLDQTIYEKGHCKGFDWQELVKIDTQLKSSILISFRNALAYAQKNKLRSYQQFSSELMRARYKDSRKYSVVSLNWDSLLEESIYTCIKDSSLQNIFDVDFCCFTNPLGSQPVHTPSITQKAKGIYNLKLLKLHGSSNWLICYSCKRLFTGLGSSENAEELYSGEKTCPCCESTIQNKSQEIPLLQPFIITPTYLKTFPNSHIQNVWDNAQIELLEADRVVFLGYSLPEADYYVRSLFRRTISKDSNIDVVLWGKDKRYIDTVERYKSFFPNDKLKFYKSGMDGFFRLSLEKPIKTNLNYLKSKTNTQK